MKKQGDIKKRQRNDIESDSATKTATTLTVDVGVKIEKIKTEYKVGKIKIEHQVDCSDQSLSSDNNTIITKNDVKGNLKALKSATKPSPEECNLVTKLLGELHGIPTSDSHATTSVLDALVRTILSQNTTDKNSRAAFLSLKQSFPTWKSVFHAHGTGKVEESIKSGGLSEIKASNIHTILAYLLREHKDKCCTGEPSYEWLREMSTEFIKEELLQHKGVGPKTVSCVLMFTLRRPAFPVDTHVLHIAKRLDWIPASASAEQCYFQLNEKVPNELKFALHILLVEHGKRCRRCSKGGKLQLPEEGECPLVNIGNYRSNDMIKTEKEKEKEKCFDSGAVDSITCSGEVDGDMKPVKKEFVPWYVKTEGCLMVKGDGR